MFTKALTIPALLIGAAGSTLTVYVIHAERQKPKQSSPIIAMFAREGGDPNEASGRTIVAWLMRPQHAGLRNRLNAACAPLEVSPQAAWIDSTEGKVCRAAFEAKNWTSTTPAPRDAFGLTTWP